MQKACPYDVRKAPIRDLLISIHRTRSFEWQTAHTKGVSRESLCIGSTCNTVQVGDRLLCNLMLWRPIGASKFVLQCIQAKTVKTLDKRSTLTFAAYCTEQKLSSSES